MADIEIRDLSRIQDEEFTIDGLINIPLVKGERRRGWSSRRKGRA